MPCSIFIAFVTLKQNRMKLRCNESFVLRSEEQIVENGEAPIILRVTIDGQSEDARIQRSVPLKMWNNVKGCSKGKDRASVELNCYIESLTVRLYQIHKELLCQEALVIPKHLW